MPYSESPGWFQSESRTLAAFAIASAERVLVKLRCLLWRPAVSRPISSASNSPLDTTNPFWW